MKREKPVLKDGLMHCPRCGRSLIYDDLFESEELEKDKCYWCGQRIDWEKAYSNENKEEYTS